jgi:L-glyceraldehyde reductase
MMPVIHWPVAFAPGGGLFPPDTKRSGWVELDLETSLVDTWKAMIKLLDTGKVKNVGVSNFSIPHIEALIKATGVTPVRNLVMSS